MQVYLIKKSNRTMIQLSKVNTLPQALTDLTLCIIMVKTLQYMHLSIAHTFSENQWCPLQRGSTVVLDRQNHK